MSFCVAVKGQGFGDRGHGCHRRCDLLDLQGEGWWST